MKNRFLISSVIALSLCSFAGVNPKRTHEHGDNVQTLVNKYINAEKQYTKKTEIFLNEEAVKECSEHFHAGQVSLKRRTYYDETVDALLMGDFDGTFANIYSGYAKNGSDMDHYFYADRNSPSISTLFTAKNVDYTVHNTTPNSFFVNLSAIASEVANHDWVLNGSVYEYTVGEISFEGGDYSDALLHKIQFFAAPLLLQNIVGGVQNYLTPEKITIQEDADKLVIGLHVSSGDSGKIEGGGTLLASASIETGLHIAA